MTHSPEQHRKKEEAMKESKHHFHNSNVMHTRDGKDHEDHKSAQMSRENAHLRWMYQLNWDE